MTGPLDDLPPAVRDRVAAAGTVRRFPPRSYLFHEHDEPAAVYLVRSGILRVDRTTESGRQILLDLTTAGEFIGELAVIDDERRSATVCTVTEAEVLSIPRREFRRLLETEPALSYAILGRVVRRLRALTSQLVEATALTASARVAARLVRLVELAERTSDECPFELPLPITQEELGQWAGLSREGTVKGMAELRHAGMIDTGRRKVQVLDLRALSDRATTAER